MAITYEGLVNFLADELAVDTAGITNDTLLFSRGVIDSFSLVSLLSYLEAEGGMMIDPSDVNLDNFDSIGRMLKYVDRVKANA